MRRSCDSQLTWRVGYLDLLEGIVQDFETTVESIFDSAGHFRLLLLSPLLLWGRGGREEKGGRGERRINKGREEGKSEGQDGISAESGKQFNLLISCKVLITVVRQLDSLETK